MLFKENNVSYLKSLTSKRDPNKEEIQKVIELYEQRRYQEQSKGKKKENMQ